MRSENDFQSLASAAVQASARDEQQTEPAGPPTHRRMSKHSGPQLLRSEAIDNFKELQGEWNAVIHKTVGSTAVKALPELVIADLDGF